MKKFTSFFAAFVLAASVSAQVTVETNWQLSAGTDPSSLPAWVGTENLCRGLGFSKTGNQLFAVSRQGGNLVHVLNAATGEKTGTLPTGTDIIKGSYFVINDGGVTEDGVVLVGSMALANGEFKVYRWDNTTSDPTLAISYPAAIGRLGDKITVTGSVAAGTARVYAVTATAVEGKSKIFYFDMEADAENPGKYKFVQTPKTLASVTTATSNPAVGFKPDGAFYYKAGGAQITAFSAEGVEGASSVSTVVGVAGNTVRYIGKKGTTEYICYFRNGAGQEKVDILELPEGNIANATVVAFTPALGANANANASSGLIVNVLENDDVELYVLSTNNGIGKYTVKGLFDIANSIEKNLADDLQLEIGENTISIKGENITSIEVLSLLGQTIKQSNGNSVSSDGLSGVYIVSAKVDGKTLKSFKAVIK